MSFDNNWWGMSATQVGNVRQYYQNKYKDYLHPIHLTNKQIELDQVKSQRDKQYSEMQSKISEYTKSYHKSIEKITCLETEICSLNTRIATKDKEIDNKQQLINSITEQFTVVNSQLKVKQQTIEKINQQLTQSNLVNQQNESKLEIEKSEHLQTKRTVEQQNEEIQQLKAALLKQEQQQEELKTRHAKEIADMRQAHQMQLFTQDDLMTRMNQVLRVFNEGSVYSQSPPESDVE